MLSLNQLMLLRGCHLVQLSWPGLPGIWQLAGNFSLSLLGHDDKAGKEENGETELKKEGGKWGTLGAQREQLNPMVTTCLTDKALAGGEAEGSLATHG